MRIFLLRLLLGWWMVPVAIVFSPMIWVISNRKEEMREYISAVYHMFWLGDYEI